MRREGDPKRDELVVCRVTKINPNSVFAEILEYGKTGMIHVSEVASRWVRDIREFVRENQYIVCKVVYVDRDHVALSLKRVQKDQANRKLNEFKREKRAEKMLEMAGKTLGKNLDQAYEEIGYKMLDDFGSLFKTFEIALKNEDLLKRSGMPEKWIAAVVDIAKKSFAEKTYRVKSELNIISYKSDGINFIKNALSKAKKEGLEVQYISAPKYVLVGEGKNYKELEAKVRKVSEEIVKEIDKSSGEATFKMEK